MNLEALCKRVTELTAEVGDFILSERKSFDSSRIESKRDTASDMVSYVDKTAEERLVAQLQVLLPEAGFITEEETTTTKGEIWNWIIDPLDGTTNFIHGLPCFAICVALKRNETVVLGVVHELNFNECFHAWEGGGAWMNDQPICVSDAKTLAESLIGIGFPYRDEGRLHRYVAMVDELQRNSHGVRRLGSAATDLAYVACGRLDSFSELDLNTWDVAAGSCILREAGGTITDFSGGNNYLSGKECVASNGHTHAAFLEAISRHFD